MDKSHSELLFFEGEEEKNARFIRAKEHVKDMMATRDYYRDRKVKREEIVAREFLKKAVRELYIEQEDRNKAKVPFEYFFPSISFYYCLRLLAISQEIIISELEFN